MEWCPLNQIFLWVEVMVYFFTSLRQISLALLMVIGTTISDKKNRQTVIKSPRNKIGLKKW